MIDFLGTLPNRSIFKMRPPSEEVAGSIPVEVIGFLNLPYSSSLTMALGPEMSTSNLPGL
jgi:hypothetical protein